MGDMGDPIAQPRNHLIILLLEKVGGTKVQHGTYLIWFELCSSVKSLILIQMFPYSLSSLCNLYTSGKGCDIIGHHYLLAGTSIDIPY